MKLIPGTTDVFTVSNPDGAAPPAICGTNSGEHSKKFFETVCDISRIFEQWPQIRVSTWKGPLKHQRDTNRERGQKYEHAPLEKF